MSTSPAGTTMGTPMAAVPPSTEQVLNVRHPTYRYDFGFLPIPKRLRYDPDKPFYFGMFLNVFFGICNTLGELDICYTYSGTLMTRQVCANLYYCQPILIQLSTSFSVTYDEVSRYLTVYGIGILTISPMGDMLRRRGLILLLVWCSTCLTIGLAVTKSLYVFEAISFLVGFASVSPQIFIPLAADLAPPERRASAISLVTSGFLMGVLIARVLSGVVANFVSWRYVYWMSIGIQGLVLIGSYLVLPDYPATNRELSYFGMFSSMAKFVVKEPLVVQILLISVSSSACYTNFWVTLTFLLGGPPYYYSTILIGLFGLFGLFGVMIVPLMGRVIDRMAPWHIALVATLFLIAFQAVQTGAGGINVAAVIISCFGLDVARQTQQVSLATLIFGISDSARSRLNSLFLIAVFLGQVMGTSVGTQVFVSYGWQSNALLAMAWFVWQLCILLLRGPHCPRQRWIGWQGGLWMKTEVGSTTPPGQASGRASDCEKANVTVTQPSTSGCTGTTEVNKKT
ncbi:major facilitator superfamily domain-containing protein [Lanmaoa asiatica]|nr:major facilitator superfamily domain-containing protein [Lanmaoa asiatica]